MCVITYICVNSGLYSEHINVLINELVYVPLFFNESLIPKIVYDVWTPCNP